MHPGDESSRDHSRRPRRPAAVLIGLVAMAAAVIAPADPLPEPAALEVRTGSVDGGGGTSQAGGVRLIGAVGQPDAGVQQAGSVVLTGGQWSAPRGELVFSDDFETGTAGRWTSAVGTTP